MGVPDLERQGSPVGGGAQQVGDAAVAGRMLGGGKLGALHSSSPNDDQRENHPQPFHTGPSGEMLSLSGHSLTESEMSLRMISLHFMRRRTFIIKGIA
jgi:hypothetical protein